VDSTDDSNKYAFFEAFAECSSGFPTAEPAISRLLETPNDRAERGAYLQRWPLFANALYRALGPGLRLFSATEAITAP
jgi:hypothetical protein